METTIMKHNLIDYILITIDDIQTTIEDDITSKLDEKDYSQVKALVNSLCEHDDLKNKLVSFIEGEENIEYILFKIITNDEWFWLFGEDIMLMVDVARGAK
jgi:hypothetical protein